MFETITDKRRIDDTLRLIMRGEEPKTRNFVPAIKIKSKNLIIEGAGILGISKSADDCDYTLTNSDSNYKQPTWFIKLSDIEYIQIL